MSASKELYRILFNRLCSGMSLVHRGSSLRFELVLEKLSDNDWIGIQHQTQATGKDLNDFYQGVRGNYMMGEQSILYDFSMKEMLSGEHLTFVYTRAQDDRTCKIGLLKLNKSLYIVTNNVENILQKGQLYELAPETRLKRFQLHTLPIVGKVNLLNLHFDTPTPFHLLLDVAVLRQYRKHTVASDILPLYNHIVSMCQGDISTEDIFTMLDIQSLLGISTFSSRIIFDCLTEKHQTA